MRKVAAASIVAIVAACTQGAQEPAPGSMDRARHDSPVALYTNGGFESGNLSSWTVVTNTNPGITYPPANISNLNLGAGGTARSFARTGATPESQIPAGMSATSTLRYPKYGTYSGVINETGATRNVNSLFQQMATTAADVDPADSLIHVRFVVAPVLQSPGHANTQQPYYYVEVSNVTQGTTLFSRFNYVNENGVPWQSDSGGAILYTGWQVVDVPGTAGSIAIGDTVEVRVIAAGCSLGGHWGEAYVDAFGAFLPGLSIAAHAPQQANAGSNLTTSYAVTNSGASAATNVTVVAPVPAQTTFLSLTTPPGAVCTTPAVGGTGNVTCNFGTMNPSSTLSFTLVTAIAAAASGSIPNGSYTVASTGNSALLGPLVTTAVTSAVSYANLSASMNDGTGGVAWGQAVQYTIVVSNAGPVTATNATVVDTLPAQLTGATWTCTAAGGGSCGAASGSGSINTTVTLPSGASATYVLSASIIGGSGTSRVTNVVNVATAGLTDPDTTNNRAADTDDIGTVVTVTVQKDATGTGLGTVVSSPAAISCGPACTSASAQFATGNLVTLTAIAEPGDTFVGWSGACSGVATTCNLNPATSVTATAKFMPQSFTISASAPAGNGNVSCTSPVLHNQSSVCTLAPAAGYRMSQLTDNASDVTALVVSNAYTISSVSANHAVVATFLKDYGTACGGAGECAGGVCADGVCCTAACAGQCQACDVPGSVGACTTVTSGAPHGMRSACATDGSACSGSCDGSSASACGYPGASTQCRAASCAAGTAVPAGSCNGTGTCPSAATTQCTPYVCSATACKTSCAADSDCIAGDYCDGTGACVPKKADGLACGGSNQCGSGNCVDGVCCNQGCAGQCQACNVAGSVGQCTPVAGAPHGARPACATDGSSCGGSCDGLNVAACAYPTAQCRSASCSAGTATAAASCNGAGSCPAPVTSSCSPYACGPTACKTSCASDSDCAASDYCDGTGACVPKKADGLACGASNQCGSGSCTDGVCCNQACNGQCQACNVAGSVGQCVAVSGAPHGGRPACGSDGSACGGSCDGANGASCAYPTAQCRSASCTAGVATASASCNGAGSCPAAVTTTCNPYVCGATACKTICTADADCVAGDYCDAGGACVPKKADGLACGGANQCGSGSCADGVCCNQACGGQCQACDVPGQVGQCVAVSGAPHGVRIACSGSGSCGGSCDGSNVAACAYPTVQCRGASCTAGVATGAASCDGAGSCPAVVTTTCNPYVCGATACKTSCTADADCVSGDYCDAAGACVSKKADGYACAAANECANGSCADGFCCERACNGQCEACDVPGSVGQCVAVNGPPHGGRTACSGSGACGGACDGANAAACAYPDSSTSCRNASCSGGSTTAAATCDGAGACPPPVTAQCDPYLCGGNACKTSCLSDSDCIAADHCDATGACVPKTVVGQACTASNQCTSGFCTDGYCCDQGCAGQCQACDVAGSEGTCTAVSGDPHGARMACRGAGTVCGGACDGVASAACAYPDATLSCRAGSCSAGTAILAAGCDGAGLCPAPQTQLCDPYFCGATACLGNCTQDVDCLAGNWCSAGVCVPKLADAQACGGSNQCASGSCVDGVCCDQTCDGQCQACDVQGSVGLCVAVSGDPHSARPACATDGSACGGSCDGAHGLACAYPTASCRGASCSAGVATLSGSCDGAGHCPLQQTQSCDPYVCGATACRGDCVLDSDCSGGNFCAAGVCTPKLVAGATCGGANQCASGFCADGVCCDQACSGQCQACDVPGSAGVCAAVLGAPHGSRQACASDGSACGGLCDGANGAACAYPTAQCRGASCSAGVATLAAACDGAGRCPAPQAQACAPYVCGATACLGNCASNADCAAGDWCSAGVCMALYANGTACGGAVQCASGNCVDGVCCNAACTGQCEACNVSGSAGLCTAVIGDPRAGRPACASDGSACAGTCDGSSRTACAYPPADSQCRAASCSNGVASAATTCDGAGHCPASQQASCNAYVCGANACKTSCSADSDCQDAGFCVASLCHSRNDPAIWMVAGGGGCAQAGPATWPLALLVLAFALRRRRRMAALTVALVATGAAAQSTSFAVDHFHPGGGAFDVLGVWSPETAGNFDWHGSVYTSYARDPLRLVALEHPDQVQLLRGQSMLHLGGSVGLLDRFEVGAVLPIAVAQASTGAPMLGGAVSGPVASGGMGDLRVLPKARLLSLGGFVLGAAAPFTLPIGRQDAYLGAGAPTVMPTVLAELQDVLPVRLLANVGVAVRGGRSLGNLKVSSAFTYGLGAELPFAVRGQPLAALATLSGEADLQRGGAVERPLELMGAIRWSALRGLDVLAGGGPGLTAGYGTPAYRLFFALSFSPQLLGSRRPPPLFPVFAADPPRPAPTLSVVAPDPPILFSRTLELARIEEDHVELLAPVLFARARDVLLPQSRAVLDAAVSVLGNHPELSLVRIEGHTDGHGKADYNLGLSKRRAKAVRLYLMQHGIDADRLQSDGFGSSRPIASNDTTEGRARNRRVEMLIVRKEAVAGLPGSHE